MPPKLLPSKGKRRGKGRRDDDEYGGYGGREQKLIKPPDQEKLTESVCSEYQNNPNICINSYNFGYLINARKTFAFPATQRRDPARSRYNRSHSHERPSDLGFQRKVCS